MERLDDVNEEIQWKIFNRSKWISVIVCLNRVDQALIDLRNEKRELEVKKQEMREKLNYAKV